MEWSSISETEVTEVLKMTLNWKAPGRVKIANFWVQQLAAAHIKQPFFTD